MWCSIGHVNLSDVGYCLLLIDETYWDGQSLDALQALALMGNSIWGGWRTFCTGSDIWVFVVLFQFMSIISFLGTCGMERKYG